MFRIRKPVESDYHTIVRLSEQYGTKFDIPHLVSLLVVTDETDNVVGYGSLVSLLEGSFLVDKTKLSHKDRVNALQGLIVHSRFEAANNGYDLFHAFTEYPNVEKLLTKHLGFKPGIGTNLVLCV